MWKARPHQPATQQSLNLHFLGDHRVCRPVAQHWSPQKRFGSLLEAAAVGGSDRVLHAHEPAPQGGRSDRSAAGEEAHRQTPVSFR